MVDFRADIERQLAPFSAHITGNPLASLVAVKGVPGEAEREGGLPFSGADGTALDKAFGRLGWGYGSKDTRTWLGVLLPSGSFDLRLVCEIVDPLAIVALDERARGAIVDAFKSTEEGFLADFTPGAQSTVAGRLLISVDGFEDALSDETAKQRAWAQLKRCAFSSGTHVI
jgi:hypothetical protein